MTLSRISLSWLLLLLLVLSGSALARELPDFTVLVEKYGPAVVNISTKQKLKSHPALRLPRGMPMPEFPEDGPWGDLFRHFFGNPGEMPDPQDEEDARSLGSGFIIDSEGYILTNNHVVDGADEILVRLNDRRELVAKVIGADKRSDLALLKVEASGLPVVKFGQGDQIKVGEWVMAIGSPFGFDHSVSVGVVSALGRSLPSESYVPFIQTDVAINPGNSGGPLFNLDGEVIGINSQIYSRTGGFMGLSFAIPVDVALDVVAQIKDKGYVSRGWLGVLIQDVTRELAESFGMKRPAGALVAKVLKDGPAAKAGIAVGDVIIEFGGKNIDASSDLPPVVGRSPVGADSRVVVIRDGKRKTLTVRVEELPKDEELTLAEGKPGLSSDNRLNLTVTDLTAEQRKELGLEQRHGVLVQGVEPGPAQEAGVRRGDVLLKLNNVDVDNVAHFNKLVRDLPAGKSIPVLVQRRSGPIFLALRLPK
ncbi:DegQ family serine endoprotease [Sulfurivermis fontis]|uniref:DegQ family serine endoprotease n=1 Tax=Sulfurivermis fontis TaxID=1972068 RepID=UPI000FDB2F2C|nr:DegQ family serine endoprotease [Sulfurivermis fontis]